MGSEMCIRDSEWMNRNPEYDVSFECIEYDDKAIEYAKNLNADFESRITWRHENALKYRSETNKYDLIWAAGIFDYFNDQVFESLFSRLLESKKQDGQIVVGNFSTSNPSRPYMEIFDWILHHRTEQDLICLLYTSPSPRDLSTSRMPSSA